MKRFIYKTIVFVLIFCFIFVGLQNVLHYRWTSHENLYTRNLDIATYDSDELDVVCFGSSEMLNGYDPIITYSEKGITGYNCAMSFRSAVTNYYALKYVLQYHTPKVVICDFASLFDDNLPSDVEVIYRRFAECMPDKELKNEFIRDVCRIDPNQSYLSWKFPMLRYHSMWNELSKKNFIRDYVYDTNYPQYSKGALLRAEHYSGDRIKINPELWTYDKEITDYSEISVEYYDKFINECNDKGIKVIAIMPPKLDTAAEYAASWNAKKEYFESRGVEYLNYNTYDAVKRIGLTIDEDYWNSQHVNIIGSVKFSKVLAEDLAKLYTFEDHRRDDSYKERWDNEVIEFNKAYDEMVNKMNSNTEK